jgi:acetylornithine deacetylase/succinyl-diaminopimelate desuccinylase-like protein
LKELEKIYNHIDQDLDKHIERVQEFLKQPSVSPTEKLYANEDVFKCAEMLLGYVKDLSPQMAELVQTDGYPVVYGRLKSENPEAKTLVLYSMYDVQPADELGWSTSTPFAASILDAEEIGLPRFYGKCIVARGARNQKGPTMAFINALKSIQECTGDIPVNVIFTIEGEEELESPHFLQFRNAYLSELKEADGVYYPNPAQDEKGRHNIYLGYKGIIDLELEVKGGDWGGPVDRELIPTDDAWVDAPAWRLVWALCTLKNPQGKVLIDGFYEDVRNPTPEEKEMLEKLRDAFDEEMVKKDKGIKNFKWNLPGKDLLEEYIMKPVVNIDGYVSGYTGPMMKTNLASRAMAKIDIRLVPNMRIDDILFKLRKHLNQHGFSEVEVRNLGGYTWSKTSLESDIAQAAIKATKAHGVEPLCWPIYYASTPCVIFTEPPLNLPAISAGLGRMGRPHEENEYLTTDGLRIFEKYVVTFLYNYAQ